MLETKRPTLMSIPEKNESGEEAVCKWIPKKKHEVLKAKYKCLKKLFQIYDASVIGILPNTYALPGNIEREERKHSRRRRSHRTKTDACAGTNEVSCGDITTQSVVEKRSVATAVIRELQLQYTTTSNPEFNAKSLNNLHDKLTQESTDNPSTNISEKECEFTQTSELLELEMPHLMVKNKQPKPTRFQMFLQRIIGIRRERSNYVLPDHIYAGSDNNISNRCVRRKRSIRFRRHRSAKTIRSETALRNNQSPVVLSYVQSVQRNCLMDTTPRQCPFVGCRMMFYGIINYNDHLNVCHFVNRKFFCHYCHEGFLRERDKLAHETEHIGIPKLNTILTTVPSDRQSSKVASVTQTDPEPKIEINEDKLKKIVSFFDKIDNPEEIIAEIKKSRHSVSNLNLSRQSSKTESTIYEARKSNSNSQRSSSCVHLHKANRKSVSSANSDVLSDHSLTSSLKCQMCGENFDQKRRLNLHVDVEHRDRNKHSKFQERADVISPQRDQGLTEDDDIRSQCSINSTEHSYTTVHCVNTSSTLSQCKAESDSCDPSTNIIYYSSLASLKKPSVMNSLVRRVRTGFSSYKWEPGTKAVQA